MISPSDLSAAEIKTCCAALYQSEWARLLLGESFHPGGLALTERLGITLGLSPASRVLDVAAGMGASALYLAERFGCSVVGTDYSAALVEQGTTRAREAGLAGRVQFQQGDAEALPFPDASFDAVVCECAFCTFPDKRAAASEIARVLRPGGKVGLADLTRTDDLPEELQGLAAWVACVADARPVHEYLGYLLDAGLVQPWFEPHDEALRGLVQTVRAKLVGVELLTKLGKLPIPLGNLEQALRFARAANAAIHEGQLGYSLIIAMR